MGKICDHTSVGILVFDDDGRILLNERKKFPFGFAPPAGHLDGDEALEGMKRELREEVGLVVGDSDFIWEGKKKNPCRREGGDWHYWRIYRAREWTGELKPSPEEAGQKTGWFMVKELAHLARLTEESIDKILPALGEKQSKDLGTITRFLSQDAAWKQNPGLEPVWYEILKRCFLINSL